MPLQHSQGETYDEEPTPKAQSNKEGEEQEPEEEEEISIEGKKKGSLDPKLIACGIGIGAICILGVSLFLYIGKNKKIAEEEESSIALEESVADLPAPYIPSEVETYTIAEEPNTPPSETVGAFSESVAKTLRKWGYTNNQMEIAQRDGISAEELVEQAKEERQEAQWEALQAVMDGASEEYQALASNTWVGQAPSNPEVFRDDVTYITSEKTENVDYVKIEAHGPQLWVKCFLGDGNVVFLSVTPMRYNQLAESGNIVISYTSIEESGKVFILSVKEVRV